MSTPPELPRTRIGTAGWSYRHWRGVFYPEGVPQRRWLEHYAGQFDTVEINSTFYHLPRESTCEGWRERVPEGFLFSVKASRFITHEKRLRDAAAEVEAFLGRARLLGDRLGPVLFQLPPGFEQDLGTLGEFLQLLPPELTAVFEFRHDTWFCDPTYELLKEGGACFCTHDMPGRPSPRLALGPSVYVRFHGPGTRYLGSYPDELLADWAGGLGGQREAGRDIYAYFNNDIGGHAVGDARRLRDLLADGPED